jgi:hypothetical protein
VASRGACIGLLASEVIVLAAGLWWARAFVSLRRALALGRVITREELAATLRALGVSRRAARRP